MLSNSNDPIFNVSIWNFWTLKAFNFNKFTFLIYENSVQPIAPLPSFTIRSRKIRLFLPFPNAWPRPILNSKDLKLCKFFFNFCNSLNYRFFSILGRGAVIRHVRPAGRSWECFVCLALFNEARQKKHY